MKKKFTTVAEVAQEIGVNHLALRLLDYLDQYHPDLALDYDFIMERADYAAEVRDKLERSGDPHGASEECNRMLMADLEFSEHEIIFDIIDSYYSELESGKGYRWVREIAVELRPQLKSIFQQYPTDNPEFTAEVAYDQMVKKLKKKIKKLLQKRDELPF
ncbi:MAG: DUF1896 domain-containing protein [Prevotellaceae bacterium]|jgi:hypothetical protein|nr:DUF1896 domain-containing protein [Prevotellaceae bacterium]